MTTEERAHGLTTHDGRGRAAPAPTLRELAERATPGPWRVGVPEDRHAIYVSHLQDDGMWVTVATTPDGADAALIVAMRNGLDALLDMAAAVPEDPWLVRGKGAGTKWCYACHRPSVNSYDTAHFNGCKWLAAQAARATLGGLLP